MCYTGREQVEQLQQYLGNTATPEQHVHMKNEVSQQYTCMYSMLLNCVREMLW